MELNALLTIAVVVVVLIALALTSISADLILMAAMAFLIVAGILTPIEALVGFANPGVMTIATLFVVAAALKETGAVQWLALRLLGLPASLKTAQFRLVFPTSLLSSLMNNTTIVVMFIPIVQEWSRRLNLAPSKLLLPLSYAAILGGTCSLIGTSTNLVVDGLLRTHSGIELGLFDIALIGFPLLLVGAVYLYLSGDRLLPDRQSMVEQLEKVREYTVEVEVEAGGPLVNKTVLAAGLRNLGYGYLAEIERDGMLLTAVEPDRTLRAQDRLFFIGAPECANELRRVRGLKPANGNVHKIDVENHQRCLVEVVLGTEFPGLGKTIRDSRFRTRFNAAVLRLLHNCPKFSII
ncbi:SLC13 family permease [Motiliproteus sp. SC1-56]|uniref:SLC13 family permease n=1 Tax=Motiliproteus sp. SC1-56 TaxID=2799565 RepID=UPI001A8E13DE|nr:SLC13 family permease [Motiliproteus sp. SC1-56]